MTFNYLFDYVRAGTIARFCESKRMIQAVFGLRKKPEFSLRIKWTNVTTTSI